MQKINAAHSHLHTHFNIVKFNFFIVHYFFDEITAQLCNPGIKTVSISLVFCEQRSHFDCCKWAHAFIYIYYTTTSIVINAVFVVSTVQISRITQHNLCVCVCMYNCFEFKSGISLGLRYLRNAPTFTISRKLIRLCKCLLNTLHTVTIVHVFYINTYL